MQGVKHSATENLRHMAEPQLLGQAEGENEGCLSGAAASTSPPSWSSPCVRLRYLFSSRGDYCLERLTPLSKSDSDPGLTLEYKPVFPLAPLCFRGVASGLIPKADCAAEDRATVPEAVGLGRRGRHKEGQAGMMAEGLCLCNQQGTPTCRDAER